MKITQVIIKNWRSIKYVDFKTDAMNIFVGANNAGKTNIMSAINFLLGDRYPMPANLLDSDYFLCDKQRDIFIQIDFESEDYSRIDFDTSREKYALKAYGKDGRQSYGFNNEHRASLAFAYVDANRSFEKQFGSSRWSLLAKLFESCMLMSWPNVTIGCRDSEIGLSKLMNYSRQIYT